MRRATLLLIFLVAACGSEADEPGSREPVQTASLTGLYEGRNEAEHSDRLCMIADPSGIASFGIVTFTDGGACSGAGEAVRHGEVLRLTMSGDAECVIEASAAGTQVRLPPSVPESCSYYCAPGSTFASKTFRKTGGTAKDAMRATDLAGDPLCG